MIAAGNPDLLIAKLALGGLLIALFWRLLVWVRESPTKPDPWDAETEKKLSAPETTQACHHCSTPLTTTAWFCPHCGSAVGQYNNLMPYVHIFSEGEVLRNVTNRRFRNRPLIVIGYGLMVLGLALKIHPLLGFIFGVLLLKNLFQAGPQNTDEI